MCRNCSYQGIDIDDLNNHNRQIHVSNNIRSQVHEKCNKCGRLFQTQNELNTHIKEDHKSHKPCDYFMEDRCDLDDEECRFKHVKLKHGEHICYTCGLIFNSRKDLLNHIREQHGNTPCYRFLNNECTVRRCLFSHKTSPAINVERIYQEARAPQSTQDFPNLHATRPVMWSQVVAENPQTQAQVTPTPHMGTTQIPLNMLNMIPQIVSQIMIALTQQNNI